MKFLQLLGATASFLAATVVIFVRDKLDVFVEDYES